MAIRTTAPGKLSPWVPEKDPYILAFVGKMGEESAELSKACHRVEIQGLNQESRDNLLEEYCDVVAAMKVVKMVIELTPEEERLMILRINAKEAHLLRWHQLLGTVL